MWQDARLLNALAGLLAGLAAAALLAAGLWWLGQRPMFTLKNIRIEAATEAPLRRVSQATVRSVALPRIRGNFFTANLDGVRQAFEAVPWVRRAAVRREWPNRLVVTLEEHVPLATWGEDGRLVSVKGDVFTANLDEAEEDGNLPELAGPEGSEKEVVTRYAEFNRWFAPVELTAQAVRLSERYAWTLEMKNGMTVQLGREQDKNTLRERVDRLLSVYPQLAARLQGKVESVDMRYPNGLALRASGIDLAAMAPKGAKKK